MNFKKIIVPIATTLLSFLLVSCGASSPALDNAETLNCIQSRIEEQTPESLQVNSATISTSDIDGSFFSWVIRGNMPADAKTELEYREIRSKFLTDTLSLTKSTASHDHRFDLTALTSYLDTLSAR